MSYDSVLRSLAEEDKAFGRVTVIVVGTRRAYLIATDFLLDPATTKVADQMIGKEVGEMLREAAREQVDA